MEWIFYNVDPGDLIFGTIGVIYLIFGTYIIVWNVIDWFKSHK